MFFAVYLYTCINRPSFLCELLMVVYISLHLWFLWWMSLELWPRHIPEALHLTVISTWWWDLKWWEGQISLSTIWWGTYIYTAWGWGFVAGIIFFLLFAENRNLEPNQDFSYSSFWLFMMFSFLWLWICDNKLNNLFLNVT